MKIFLKQKDKNSIIYSDRWRGYNGLVDLGYKKHYRLDHGKDEFVNGKSHINGIESFWGYAKKGWLNIKACIKNLLFIFIRN